MGTAGPQLLGMGAARDPAGAAGVRLADLRNRGGVAGRSSNQRGTFQLAQRVAAAYNAFVNPTGQLPIDTDPTTLDTGSPAAGRVFAWQEHFKTDNTRMQTYEDVTEMDETTDEVAAALDVLADSAVNPEDGSQHTFVIEIDEGPYRDQAETIFDQVTESLDLQRDAYTIARSVMRDGDVFLELVIDDSDGAMKLARQKILPPGSIWRNEDASGNLMTGVPQYDAHGQCMNEAGECAFDQRDQQSGRMLASFYPWQIVHFRWARRGSNRYGRSALKTARLVWKKLKACEEALVIARLQRAWMRFVHYVDTTGMTTEDARAELGKYRQELTRRFVLDTQLRENPFEVTSDFYLSSGYIRDLDGNKFLPKAAKIEVLQGDHAVLAAIHDIEYFQNKLFASLRVPKAYIGFERDINSRNTLSTQDIQFARTLRRIQGVLSEGYKEIFDFALIMAGLDPAEVHYTIRWPAILVSDEERDAFIRRMYAEADAIYWQMGSPSTRYLVQERFGWDDEAWLADLEMAMSDPPPRLKISPLTMPATATVAGAPGDNPDVVDQQMDRVRQAAIAAMKDVGSSTDVPPDAFDQNKTTTDAAQRSARSKRPDTKGNMRRPSAANSMEEALAAYSEEEESAVLSAFERALRNRSRDHRYLDVSRYAELRGRAGDAEPARSHIFVPGMGRQPGASFQPTPGYTRELSIAGVHGRPYQPPRALTADTVRPPADSHRARVAGAAHLSGFFVDLVARRQSGPVQTEQ